MSSLLTRIRRFLCGLMGHGSEHERVNDGPWLCLRCGGENPHHNKLWRTR